MEADGIAALRGAARPRAARSGASPGRVAVRDALGTLVAAVRRVNAARADVRAAAGPTRAGRRVRATRIPAVRGQLSRARSAR